MRIIALKTIRNYWRNSAHKDSKHALESWYAIASKADWASPQDVKEQFGHASFVGNERVVFNIAGNKYRLVVRFNYAYRLGYVRFIGTHFEYDSIDVETI